MADRLLALLQSTGFHHLTPGMVVMWAIGLILIHLAIARRYEPLLLLPIGFGVLVATLLLPWKSGIAWHESSMMV